MFLTLQVTCSLRYRSRAEGTVEEQSGRWVRQVRCFHWSRCIASTLGSGLTSLPTLTLPVTCGRNSRHSDHGHVALLPLSLVTCSLRYRSRVPYVTGHVRKEQSRNSRAGGSGRSGAFIGHVALLALSDLVCFHWSPTLTLQVTCSLRYRSAR